jgi:hypothetical protein
MPWRKAITLLVYSKEASKVKYKTNSTKEEQPKPYWCIQKRPRKSSIEETVQRKNSPNPIGVFKRGFEN